MPFILTSNKHILFFWLSIFSWNLYLLLNGLHLSSIWPIFSEEVVTENDDCYDFDPLLSQQWAVSATLLEDLPVLLRDSVQEYIKLSTKRETIEQLFRKIQNIDDNFDIISSISISENILRIRKYIINFQIIEIN